MIIGRLDRASAVIAFGGLCSVGLMFGGCGRSGAAPVGNVAQPVGANDQVTLAPSPAAALPPASGMTPLQRAFRAVFDADSPVTEAGNGRSSAPRTTAKELVSLDDTGAKEVLVTSTYLPGANQGTTGYLDIYYLGRKDGDFVVRGKWPEAMSGFPHGGEPRAVSITDRFGPTPAIYAEGAWSGQGNDCTFFDLTELTPDGPESVALVRLSYSNKGAAGSGAITIDGKIAAVVPGKSFTIRYTGSQNFTETWTRKGDHYVLPGETRMRTCG